MQVDGYCEKCGTWYRFTLPMNAHCNVCNRNISRILPVETRYETDIKIKIHVPIEKRLDLLEARMEKVEKDRHRHIPVVDP